MHLVFASSLVPCGPPTSGFEIANAAIADGLRRAGARVTHLGFQGPGKALSDPDHTVCLGAQELTTENAGMAQKLAWLAAAVRHGVPFASAKLRSVPEARFASALDGIGTIDGVIVNGTAIGGAFEQTLTGRPYLYIAHNVEHVTAAEAGRHAGAMTERLMYRREARLLAALERRLTGAAAHVLTLSAEDREGLGLGDTDRASVLPLVTPEQPAGAGARVPAFDIGMIGTWTWAPNRVGLEWFLQEVMPHLPETATVAVAGQLPAGFPKRDKRVRFLGRVIDAGQFVRQCRVIALTARTGTGVQLKTLETFEAGLPAVATHSSLRGIGEVPANVRTADEPKRFAEALADLVIDHRTGTVTDLDGSAFRDGQIARMDAVLARALIHLRGSAG
jgi:hypothetical protein